MPCLAASGATWALKAGECFLRMRALRPPGMNPVKDNITGGPDPGVHYNVERVSTHPDSQIAELLPDRWKPLQASDPSDRKG